MNYVKCVMTGCLSLRKTALNCDKIWKDAENGFYDACPHEAPFYEYGNVIQVRNVLPEALPEGADSVLAQFHEYYRGRAFHERAVNSNGS